MTRHFREDSERIVKVRGMWVRRPQAQRIGSEHATLQDVAEIIGGTFVLLILFAALAYGPWLLWGGR